MKIVPTATLVLLGFSSAAVAGDGSHSEHHGARLDRLTVLLELDEYQKN